MIKTILAYPGGKSRICSYLSYLAPEYQELREPFFGGGSFTIYEMQKHPNRSFFATDKFHILVYFWQIVKECPYSLINLVQDEINHYLRNNHLDYNELLKYKKQISAATFKKEVPQKLFDMFYHPAKEISKQWNIDFNQCDENSYKHHSAFMFYLINRTSFSGMFRNMSFTTFYRNFIFANHNERILKLSKVIQTLNIEVNSYENLLQKEGDDVFIFLDPPYNIKEFLYGQQGLLHKEFNHEQFIKDTINCKHRWLLTYNDCELVRDSYNTKHYKIIEIKTDKTMNCKKGQQTNKANELIIMNY